MATPVSVTHVLQANTLAKASDVNDNFNDLVVWINANVPHRDGTVAFTGVPSIPSGGPTSANQVAHKAYVDAFLDRMVPAGTVVDYAGSAAPSGWALMNGQTLAGASASYPELWAVAPAAWKSGNDLVLPDLSGRVTIGAGSGSGLTTRALGASGGAETHTLTVAQMPSHDHGGDTDVPSTANTGTPNTPNTSGPNAPNTSTTGSSATKSDNQDTSHSHTITNNPPSGGSVSFVTRHGAYQPFTAPFFRVASDLNGDIQLGYATSTQNQSASHKHEIPHTHTLNNHTHTLSAHTHSLNNHKHDIDAQGDGDAHNNMQPFYVLNKIIKVS